MEIMRRGNTEWVRGSCIGRGCYGTVHMAVNKSDGQIFAVKSIDVTSCLAAQSDALENEIRILRSISSPWVVEYLSDDATIENGATSFRNLHMEYMPGGTAADVAKDEEILRSHVYCILAGLRDVHSAGIVHCDVKGRNILIGSSPSVAKLADFGSARFATESTAGPHGSPLWMAPEVVRGEYQGPESDIWSLGCTVIEMMTGRPPWEDPGSGRPSGHDSLIRIGYLDELPGLPAQMSELGKDFVDKCLRRDRAERWSCDQLLRHPFVSSSEPLDSIRHSSPRCVLDWTVSEFSDNEEEYDSELVAETARERIGRLASNAGAIWESDGWLEVRDVMSEKTEQEVGTSLEYSDFSGAEVEIRYLDFGDGAEGETEFSWILGHRGFTAGENILFVNLIILTAIICTWIWFTIIKMLQLLFRFYLRFQSSHVTILPRSNWLLHTKLLIT